MGQFPAVGGVRGDVPLTGRAFFGRMLRESGEQFVNTNIENKVVLITGASSGIGEATARTLADRGARVVLGARREDRLKKIAAEIREAGGLAACRTVDVTSLADVKAFSAFGAEQFGAVDVLVNNAGIMPLSPLHQGKVDEWNACSIHASFEAYKAS